MNGLKSIVAVKYAWAIIESVNLYRGAESALQMCENDNASLPLALSVI
jgi:hypothetical protein